MADDRREVVVTDVKIPFVSMMILMVKWAVAAIPALFILIIILALVSMILGLIFGTGWHRWGEGTWM